MSGQRSSVFRFKQFAVNQEGVAMKVGTDGVLLGAWVGLDQNPGSILDIGSGTGLIALMLAQRSYADQIDALEIEDSAFETCTQNFEDSPWGDRLFCYHAAFQEFVLEFGPEYDLIVCNPPFHAESVRSSDKARDRARQQSSLSFEALLQGAAGLLTPIGSLNVIIPYWEEENFLQIAQKVGLFPFRLTRVKGTPDAEIKRSLISLGFQPETAVHPDLLIIESERHRYTPEFDALTRNFYLKS